MKNVVGLRIREARLRGRQKVSQEELSARVQALGIDLDQGAISRVESGERQVTDIELLAICEVLRISIGSLFSGIHLPQETEKPVSENP